MQKFKRLISPLKNLEIYGVPIRVNFQNQEVQKTAFGAIDSIIIFLMFGFSCYIYFYQLFQRNNLIVVTTNNCYGFQQCLSQTIYNPFIIQATASISNLKRVQNETANQYQNKIEKSQIKIRPCNTQDIRSDKLKDYFSQIALNQYFCFDDNQEVYVQGDFSGDFYTRVDIFFSQCKNSTFQSSTICQTQEQINKATLNLYFLAYMIDDRNQIEIDKLDRANVASKDKQPEKEDEQKNNKQTEDQDQDQQLAKSTLNVNQKASIQESLVINSFNLKKSQNFIFTRKESEYVSPRHQIEDGKESDRQFWKSDSQLTKDISIKQLFLDRFKSILNPNKIKINFSLIEYTQSILSCANSKMLNLKKFFILKGVEKVQNHLGIQYILQKLQEVEKLKQVILNEDQIRLFELLSRTILRKSDTGKYENKTHQFYDKVSESYEEQIENAHKSLINILNQRKKSQRDHQLIQLLDKQIYQAIKNTGLLSNSIDSLNQSQPNYPIDNNFFQQNEVNEYPICRNSRLDVPEENSQITSSNYFNHVRNSKPNALNKK
ncbi:hypothetical protein ABPG72_010841 [Tetrahymena utriculariae]